MAETLACVATHSVGVILPWPGGLVRTFAPVLAEESAGELRAILSQLWQRRTPGRPLLRPMWSTTRT